MKTFRIEAWIRCAAFVQAENAEAAISEVARMIEWPGGLLDEEYSAEECSCSDVLDWMNKNNRFRFGLPNHGANMNGDVNSNDRN